MQPIKYNKIHYTTELLFSNKKLLIHKTKALKQMWPIKNSCGSSNIAKSWVFHREIFYSGN